MQKFASLDYDFIYENTVQTLFTQFSMHIFVNYVSQIFYLVINTYYYLKSWVENLGDQRRYSMILYLWRFTT